MLMDSNGFLWVCIGFCLSLWILMGPKEIVMGPYVSL